VGGIGAVLVAATALTLTTRGSSRHDAPPLAHRPDVHAPGRSVPGVHTAARIGSAVQLVSNASPLRIPDPAATAVVAAAEQRLSIRLLQTVDGPGNVSVSPASLYLALGMLENGARGQTRAQISTALQAAGLSTADQNAGLAGLTDELAAAAKHAGIAFQSANSLWQMAGLPLHKQFLAELARYYRAGVWQADFLHHNADALAAINMWTSRHTHGKIKKLFDQLDPSTVLVLANAIYFHAAWATAFDGHVTTDGNFTTGAGKRVPAKFMIGGPGLLSGAGTGYEAAQLPYRGGRFVGLAVMPTSGSVADFVADLTPERIDSIAAALQPATEIALPRFTTTSKLDLVPVLTTLGMSDAFTPAADLSGLSPECGCQVDQVLQRVYLGVGEKGTTAAAVTGISVIPASTGGGLPALRFDHPFVFLIRDTQTGAILFASTIDDPTAP
jgi:serpin B